MPYLNLQLLTVRDPLCPVCCCNLTSACVIIRTGIAICFPCARNIPFTIWRLVYAAAHNKRIAHWWSEARGVSVYTPPDEVPRKLAVHLAYAHYFDLKAVPALPEFSDGDDRDQT